MASRFGPHGLMSVKCLYACDGQPNMSEHDFQGTQLLQLKNLPI